MNILHVSHTGLPDRRIERQARLMKRLGHKTVFLGTGEGEQGLDAFSEIIIIPSRFKAGVNTLYGVILPNLINTITKTIYDVDPDVIHAHNPIAAIGASRSKYPTIYDDHEWWSRTTINYIRSFDMLRLPARIIKAVMFSKWEKELTRRHPTIVTNDRVASEQRKKYPSVRWIKNYPLMEEVEHIGSCNERSGLVYIGSDLSLKRPLSHRTMNGIDKIIKFDVISGVTHDTMMEELCKKRVGLIPWKPIPFHWYCSPNKLYEYMHCGLSVVTNYYLKRGEAPRVPYVHEFKKSDYSDIKHAAKEASNHDSEDIIKYARENFVMENVIGVLFESYEEAMNN